MDNERYRRLPANPTRFFVVALPRAYRKCWLEVDDTGTVLESSPSFHWAQGKAIEQVETWCRSRSLMIRRMHGNIRDIRPYL